MFSKNKIFTANVDTVPEMMNYIAGIMKKFTPEIVYKITLACEEILTNIASYAYTDGDGQLAIAWEEEVEHRTFKLRFEDTGIPFNPLLRQWPNLHAPLAEREIGGLGIVIICGLMDDIQYTYVDGKNRLIITKKY